MLVKEAVRLNNINEYYFSVKLRQIAQMNAEGKKVINLGIGSPDMDAPSLAVEELCETAILKGIHGYQSYKGIPELRNAIADWNKRVYDTTLNPETEILPLMGSKEGIMHISLGFVNLGDIVLIPNPGYPTYSAVSNIAGAKLISYNLNEHDHWNIDLEKIKSFNKNEIKLVWVNYPHMPTGTKANKKILQELIQLALEKNFIIVNDNPYSTILCDEPFSIFNLENAKDVCLELNSLSKSHNMAGWRIGWVAGHQQLIDIILKVKSNMDSGMFLPLQKAAVKALSVNHSWINKLNNEYIERKILAEELLKTLKCTVEIGQGGMFVWAKVKEGINGEQLSDTVLQSANVFITPGFIFGTNGDKFVRVSLCSKPQVFKEAIQRIKELK